MDPDSCLCHTQGEAQCSMWLNGEHDVQILLDEGEPAQLAAFLVLLQSKVWSLSVTVFPWGRRHTVAAARTFSVLQGQTPQEIAGLARAMREKCVPVFAGNDVLDIVGTGGDGIGSVNISTGQSFFEHFHRVSVTLVALVQMNCNCIATQKLHTSTFCIAGACVLAAAAGAKVAKHGNRSVSSMCGSADVLEASHPSGSPPPNHPSLQ